MLKRLFLLMALSVPAGLLAQARFGYLNYSEVLRCMPQYAEAESQLNALQEKYDAEIRRSENEFTRKYTEFLQDQKDFPQNILVKRHRELQELMEKSIAFKSEIRGTLQTARDKMLEPLSQDLNDAIAKTAVRYGLEYVVDMDSGVYLYVDVNAGMDITDAVKSALGIQIPVPVRIDDTVPPATLNPAVENGGER